MPPPQEEGADLPDFFPVRDRYTRSHLYRGFSGQLCVVSSLTSAAGSINKLVCHAPRSGGAPVHGNPGHGTVRGSQ